MVDPDLELRGGGGRSWFSCVPGPFPFCHFFFFYPKKGGPGLPTAYYVAFTTSVPIQEKVFFVLFILHLLWKLTTCTLHSIDFHLFKKTCFTRVLTVFVLLTDLWEKNAKEQQKACGKWVSQVVLVSVDHLHFFPQGSSSKRESTSSLLLHGLLILSVYLQEDLMCNPIISCLACCHEHSVVCVLAERLVRNKSQFLKFLCTTLWASSRKKQVKTRKLNLNLYWKLL